MREVGSGRRILVPAYQGFMELFPSLSPSGRGLGFPAEMPPHSLDKEK